MGTLVAATGPQALEAVGQLKRGLGYRAPVWISCELPGAAAAVSTPHRVDTAPAGGATVVVDTAYGQPVLKLSGDLDAITSGLAAMRGDVHAFAATAQGAVVYRGVVSPRPLCYTIHGGQLAVASRPGPLAALRGARPDPAGLAPFLVPQMADPAGTAWEQVHRLPPGHALQWRDGTATITRVSHLAAADVAGATDAELVKEFRNRMRWAVARCSRGEDALLLSGGIDSAALAAAYSTLPNHRATVRAYTLSYEHIHEVDERDYAAEAAKHAQLELHHLPADGLLPWAADFPDGDEPEAWSYAARNWAMLSMLAAQTPPPAAVVAGEGGDELLLGQVYAVADVIARGEPCTDPLADAPVVAHLLAGDYTTRSARVDRALTDLPPWFTPRWLQEAGVIDRLADGYPGHGPPGEFAATYSRALVDEAGAAGRAQCGGWWEDTGRRAGLDIVYPFLDPDLAALTWALPPRLLRDQGVEKVVLREAFAAELPASIAARRDKAEALSLLNAGLAAAGPVRVMAEAAPLAELGIVDPVRLEAALERHAAGDHRNAPGFWATAAVGRWLERTTG